MAAAAFASAEQFQSEIALGREEAALATSMPRPARAVIKTGLFRNCTRRRLCRHTEEKQGQCQGIKDMTLQRVAGAAGAEGSMRGQLWLGFGRDCARIPTQG